MSSIASIKVWTTEILTSTDLNAWFTEIRSKANSNMAWLDNTQTFTANQTINPSSGVALTITDGGITVTAGGITITAGGLTVSAGGITATGNSTITGTLGGLTGLTVDSGGATITDGGLTVTAGGITITAGGLGVTAGNLTMGGGQAVAKRVDDGDSGASLTVDWDEGNYHRVRLTDDCTLTLDNPEAGASYVLELLQDGTGSHEVTWPAAVKWGGGVAPTLTTTINRKDVFVFVFNGTNYLGAVLGLNYVDTV